MAGWLGKVRFWPSGRRIIFVYLVPDVHFGIPPIRHWTTLRRRGSSVFPCIIRDSSSGLIGVPQSASLLEMGPGRWLHALSRDKAMAGAIHVAAGRLSDADEFRHFAGDGIEIDRKEPRSQ